jgi:hypothetical protein
MRTHIIRVGLGAAAALAALALAGPALAAMSPRIEVGGSGQAKTLTLGARLGQTDDWLGRLQVYVPSGYSVAAPSPGAAAGTVTVQAVETQVGPSNITKLAGSIKGIGATDAGVSWATTNCDNTAHAGALMVTVMGGDDSWSFPVFVDQTTGNETQFGSQKLVFCFGPREPGGTNPMSNKLLSLSLTLNGVTVPTKAGDYLWRSLWTPFAGATGDALDQNASVEAQSTAHVTSGILTINAKRSRSHVLVSGKLVVDGEAMDRVTVRVKHGALPSKLVTAGGVKTGSGGMWSLRTSLAKSQYFQAGVTIGTTDLGASGCKASFGVPCLDATVGGTSFVSRLLHLRR